MGLRIIEILAKLKDSENIKTRQGIFSPVFRLLMSLLIIILTALSGNAIFSISILAILLIIVAVNKAADIVTIVKPVIFPVMLTVIIMLPAVFMGNPKSMLTVSLKVLISLLTISIMNFYSGWQGLSSALDTLRLPEMFIMVMDTTIRYIHILGQICSDMDEAVRLRRIGKKDVRKEGLSGIAGTAYLRSKDMAYSMSEAMTCRCFTGKYKTSKKYGFTGYDLLCIIFMALILIYFIYTEKI